MDNTKNSTPVRTLSSGYVSNKGFIILTLIYALLISLLIGAAIWHDSILFSNELIGKGISAGRDSFLPSFIIIFGLYLFRILLLCAPLLSKNKKWESVTKLGLYFGVIIEFFIVLIAISMLFTKQESCSTYGSFSDCGWGLLIILPILASAVLQIFGMIIGFFTALRKS